MLQNIPTESITITEDLIITVPSTIQLMTPYVLMEQKDWFEDEIKFLRKIIKPGQNIIDIGANYGLYTLSMAQKIGTNGKVWSFEPTPSVADCLRKSITANNLKNIELIQAGLSDHNGRASFYTSPNAELNSLHPEDTSSGNIETIELVTLDTCAEKYNWKNIHIIKLDAEGEEVNIAAGGKKTLAVESPLIMFELKKGDDINTPLIDTLEEYGYKTYYLIPEHDFLVPFDKEKPLDCFQLNLFCCKHEKATELENEGFLIKSLQQSCSLPRETSSPQTIWMEYISKRTFSQSLAAEWSTIKDENKKNDYTLYQEILDTYVLSQSKNISPRKRFCYLTHAYNELSQLVKNSETFPRLMSLSRIAYEAGKRKHAVEILAHLIQKFGTSVHQIFEEPFIPVLERYENAAPGDRIKEWAISSILEQYEKLHAFSSYFTGKKSLQLLKQLNTMGFQSLEMKRRLLLIQDRFNIPQN